MAKGNIWAFVLVILYNVIYARKMIAETKTGSGDVFTTTDNTHHEFMLRDLHLGCDVPYRKTVNNKMN